jgi:hypothetical protein
VLWQAGLLYAKAQGARSGSSPSAAQPQGLTPLLGSRKVGGRAAAQPPSQARRGGKPVGDPYRARQSAPYEEPWRFVESKSHLPFWGCERPFEGFVARRRKSSPPYAVLQFR